ncbi:MAG: hypothetical protein IK093_03425 [Ruminiclostridium sp.]|nr:hypothetical protein [Ruminiclostridium sp.]
MYFISINGQQLPTPYYYCVTSKDIESSGSGRFDETGVVHRSRVRHNVKTCDVKWKIPGSQLSTISGSMADELLHVTLLDPATSGYVSCDMYAESSRAEFYQHQNAQESDSWWEISCRLIEF